MATDNESLCFICENIVCDDQDDSSFVMGFTNSGLMLDVLKYNYNITLFLAVRLAPLVTRALAASSLFQYAALCSGVSLFYIT